MDAGKRDPGRCAQRTERAPPSSRLRRDVVKGRAMLLRTGYAVRIPVSGALSGTISSSTTGSLNGPSLALRRDIGATGCGIQSLSGSSRACRAFAGSPFGGCVGPAAEVLDAGAAVVEAPWSADLSGRDAAVSFSEGESDASFSTRAFLGGSFLMYGSTMPGGDVGIDMSLSCFGWDVFDESLARVEGSDGARLASESGPCAVLARGGSDGGMPAIKPF